MFSQSYSQMYNQIDIVVHDFNNPQFLGTYGENFKIYKMLDLMEKGQKNYENTYAIQNKNYSDYNENNIEITNIIKNIIVSSKSYFKSLFF
jgi:hypothetical protein